MTRTWMTDVADFHHKMGQFVGDTMIPDVSVSTDLRVELIREEFEELLWALSSKDKLGNLLSESEQIIAVADALADLTYVINGAAVTWGIDLDAVFKTVHESNMTKSVSQKRADGKVIKGPDYVPPDIAGALWRATKP